MAYKDKKKLKKYQKKWYRKNRKKANARAHRYYKRNRRRIYLRVRAWRLKNRKKWNAICNKWRKSHPRKVKQISLGCRLKRLYGISVVDKQNMFNAQKGQCPICLCKFKKLRDGHVDHNHKTKKTRGLLCSRCNQMLGFSKDSVLTLSKAIKYLRKYA